MDLEEIINSIDQEPYYREKEGVLYCVDCMDMLPQIPKKSIDLVFADPPFNVGKGYEGYKDKRNDYIPWCNKWIEKCFTVLKSTGAFYLMNIENNLIKLLQIMDKYGVFQNLIVWKNPSAVHNNKSYWHMYQPIMVFTKTNEFIFNAYAETRKTEYWGRRKSKGQLGNIWDDIPFVYSGSIHHKEAIIDRITNKKIHPTQMPIDLARRAIIFHSNTHNLVLDPFIGSGTTAVASKKLGRQWIGIEISQKYCDIAIKRLKKVRFGEDLRSSDITKWLK